MGLLIEDIWAGGLQGERQEVFHWLILILVNINHWNSYAQCTARPLSTKFADVHGALLWHAECTALTILLRPHSRTWGYGQQTGKRPVS